MTTNGSQATASSGTMTSMNKESPWTPFLPGGPSNPRRRGPVPVPAKPTYKEIKQHQLDWRGMQPKPAMVCPHCQVKGRVQTREVRAKKGISGGKATAAVLTAGVSMLATGLSRKEVVTEARCANCDSRWTF
jgi:hypothetical protein